MRRGKKIYEGKANTLYEVIVDGVVSNDLIEMESTDRISAGNGKVTDEVDGKGAANNLLSTLLFKRFNKVGIPTHYVSEGTTPTAKIVRKCEMIKLEVIGRNKSAGSFVKRYKIREGLKFKDMILELTLKDDELEDPLIVPDAAVQLGVCTLSELADIEHYTCLINHEAKQFFRDFGLDLVDFKVEFGISEGKVLLADEFSQDTCRLWDANGLKVDKDIFRGGGSKEAVSSVYEKMLKMLQSL